MNIPNVVKKDVPLAESNAVRPWHKSAPWLISAVMFLGLMVIFHT